jgi:hypothetical protein
LRRALSTFDVRASLPARRPFGQDAIVEELGDGEVEVTAARPAMLPWERRVVRSIITANSARVGVVVLRVLAVVIAAAAVVGELLYVTAIDDRGGSSLSPIDDPGAPAKLKWAIFLQGIASPLAFAGLVLAASFLVAVYAARLDLDIVQADDEEFDVEQRRAES